MDGWTKIAAGVVLGVAGTVYATNRKVRARLPQTARDLPESVRRRFEGAVSAAREASDTRRQEILSDLQRRSASHAPRDTFPDDATGVDGAGEVDGDISGEAAPGSPSEEWIDQAARETLKPEAATGGERPEEPRRDPERPSATTP